LALVKARGIVTVVSAKGAKQTTLNVKTATEEGLLALLLGPTGNLRAPTAVVGKTLLVGFSPAVYSAALS